MMERILARALVSAGLMVVAALLGLAAAGLFLTAVYLAVLPLGQPWLAPASTSAVALLIALALAAVAIGRRERRPAPGSTAGREGKVALALGQDLGKGVGRWFQAHKKHAVVAALAAGFAFGVSPRLRQTVRRLLGN